MTEHQQPSRSALGIVAGTFGPAIIGAIIGLQMGLGSWDRPAGLETGFVSFLWASFSGVMLGALPLLVIGFILAWHGGALAVSEDAAASAPLWGIIVGGLVGLSLGPLLGLVCGAMSGHLLTGTLYGLYAGPIAGIISWEMSFFAPRFLRG